MAIVEQHALAPLDLPARRLIAPITGFAVMTATAFMLRRAAPEASSIIPVACAVLSGLSVSALALTLGACLLNPGEMGFEPLKPVGEPDAANSRIRFDVRLGGSFAAIVRCTVSEVAKLSRLRVRPGTGSAPGRASRYCGRGRRGPTRWRPSRRRARETDGSRAPA